MLMVKHVLKRRWGSKNDWSLRDCLDEMNRREYNERKIKNFKSLIFFFFLIGGNGMVIHFPYKFISQRIQINWEEYNMFYWFFYWSLQNIVCFILNFYTIFLLKKWYNSSIVFFFNLFPFLIKQHPNKLTFLLVLINW